MCGINLGQVVQRRLGEDRVVVHVLGAGEQRDARAPANAAIKLLQLGDDLHELGAGGRGRGCHGTGARLSCCSCPHVLIQRTRPHPRVEHVLKTLLQQPPTDQGVVSVHKRPCQEQHIGRRAAAVL